MDAINHPLLAVRDLSVAFHQQGGTTLRLDLDAQRRPTLNSRRSRIVLRRSGPGDPHRCNGEHHKPRHPYAHGFVPG